MNAPAADAFDVLERRDPAADSRFTWGLVLDVFDVLERHGYRRGGDRHIGQAFGLLLPLTRAYEGSDDAAVAP